MVTKSVIFVLVLLMVITAGCGGGVVAVPAPNVFTIKVTDNGAPVSGVGLFIDLPGQGTGTEDRITDSFGKATFSATTNGDYTITPSKTGYTFIPSFKTCTWTGLSSINVNFEANKVASPLLATTVTDNGNPVSGVRLTIDTPDDDVVLYTDVNGTCNLPDDGAGSYTITPIKLGYAFSPTSKTVTWDGLQQINVDFEANSDGRTIEDIYEDIVFPALQKAQKAMWDVDPCPRICHGCYPYDGGSWCLPEYTLWPRTIPDEYGGDIYWSTIGLTYLRSSSATYNNFNVSVNGIPVALNGYTTTEFSSSSLYHDGYMENGGSIVITGNFSVGTVNVTDFRINFECRQPTDGTMTIECAGETYTTDIYLDTRFGRYEYGFFEGMKPCAISCTWDTNCGCSNSDDQEGSSIINFCKEKLGF